MKCLAAVFLCLVLLFPSAPPAHAEGSKTVRVGWYESPFNMTDENGRRSGYAYEYQAKVAAYTGWEYEYVQGSWPELLQKLIDGEIDLMSDVSYTPARAEQMLFPSLAMGTGEYYIFILSDSASIRQDDLGTLDGKRIGVDKGSVQIGLYNSWAEQNGVRAELVELTGSEADAIRRMQDGEIDAFLTLDAYGGLDTIVPVYPVGSSDFFFAVSKQRPDLLSELNTAMNRIQGENRYFNQQLALKYISASGANLFLNADEINWLSERESVIRVGYQDNYLAFCAADENGELTGALKAYLEHASTCIKNARLAFEPIAYPTAGAAVEALKNGEVDCVFPSNLGASDGEALGLVMTPALMSSDIYAAVRSADRNAFFTKEQVTAAIEANDPNDQAVLLDHFPAWRAERYSDAKSCFEAVSDGRADCVLISNYQFNALSGLLDQYGLTLLNTGENMAFYFAVKRGDNALYSILTRTTGLVSSTSINAALNDTTSEKKTVTFGDFFRHNPAVVAAALVGILALMIIVIFQRQLIVVQREAKESQNKLEDLDRHIFMDAVTHVRNKNGYDSYMQELQARIDQGEKIEMAIGVFDCDHLKEINDRYGHDKGNLYLRAACDLICRVFQHSAVFRLGGDEFTVVFIGQDFDIRNALMRQFEEEEQTISASAKHAWEKVSVTSGVAVYDPQLDPSLNDLVCRAKQTMLENRLAGKEHPGNGN